ncbi:MAG: glycoside hydrolase family 3 N-terminal domain-containing protein [Actinomycetota bacterium]
MTEPTPNNRRSAALGALMPGFVGTELPEWIAALLREGLGGVCLFGHNVDTPPQIAALTAAIHAASSNAVVAIDEEGGDVSRLHQRAGSPFPGNAVLGRIGDVETTRAVGHEVGVQLAEVGIDLTFAPVVDVNSDPDNPVIGVRSFGADPSIVAAHSTAWTNGVQAAGVGACAKHFPGHGDTTTDSHVSEPVVTTDAATLNARELVPFRAAITAGTRAIMTSHIRVPALDRDAVATFSPAILGGLLRDELGFDGVIVTDALDMAGASGTIGMPAAAVAAVAAGADLLCLGSKNSEHEVEAIVDALVCADRDGRIPPGRLVAGARRSGALAQWATAARSTRTPRDPSTGAAAIDVGRIASSFALSARARMRLASPIGPTRWVRIEPEPNIAVGDTPLGPFFDGGARPALVVPLDNRDVAVGRRPEPGALTLVVGRELHRDAAALTAAAAIVDSCDALVVDLGFVDTGLVDTGVVDIATFGASRIVGEALLALIGGAG